MLARIGLLLLAAWTLRAADPYLFFYFMSNGETGVFYALSDDGYKWTPVKEGHAWLKPEKPEELMRDPFVAKGPDGVYHMVWTWGWKTPRMGHASSKDLIRWSQHQEIPVMAETPGVKNVWAPELFYDQAKKQWILFWSTTVEGRFPESAGQVESGYNHRAYLMTTRDFAAFSEPRLFFDPGYAVIDGTILAANKQYYLFFKDERSTPVRKQMLSATSNSPEGPWANISGPFTQSWTEGPSLLRVGSHWVMYFDYYRKPQYYGGMRSSDLKTWEEVSKQMSFPAGARHGSFLQITRPEAERLRSVN